MIEKKAAEVQGLEVDVITMSNDVCRAVLTNLGARLVELHVPDRDGNLADVVLQRPSLEDMATDDNYMGSTAGRYANRIRDGKLVIGGTPVQLSLNEGANHLHGGLRGFDRHSWSTELAPDGSAVTFWRISPNGEEGYPGTLTTSVTYRLEESALSIDIRAATDAADDLLPTGEVLAVEGTPFDFRKPRPVGENMAEVSNAGAGRVTQGGTGYDHNWVLEGTGMREVVFITDPRSGRRLTMSTNQPGVQLYVGGYLDGVTGKAPAGEYQAFAGLTLETQTFPDAVNHSHFPQAELHPGQTYLNSMRFVFSAS